MKEQLRRGRLKYISFMLLDLLCLITANILAANIYLKLNDFSFTFASYAIVVVYMIVIDVLVTFVFNTLNRVLRRRKRKELIESLKHVFISFVILALVLFSTKQGAEYSRVTVYMAYVFYLIFIIGCRILWKNILKKDQAGKSTPTALLVTTAGYASEGLGVVEKAGMTVKGMFITDKNNEGLIQNIPVIVDRQDATAFLCWEWIDKVFVCGPDNIDVPELLVSACQQMGIPIYTTPIKKNLEYEVIKIRTVLQKDHTDTGLSFFEGEHDVPFRISRLYTIFETEQDNQRGFHAHKQSWHLLFCPFGVIDVIVDTGRERKMITLDDPSTGLILHPGVWREIIWKRSGSVLCVAASGHYDANKLRDDYDQYLKFLQEKEWSATIESAEIMGESLI